MTNPADMIGLWSVDRRFGSGAQEDCLAYFGADGRGVYVRLNLAGSAGCVFLWALEHDALTTRITRLFADMPPELSDIEGEAWEHRERPVAVGEETTLVGPQRILRFTDGTSEEDAFAFLHSNPPRAIVEALNL